MSDVWQGGKGSKPRVFSNKQQYDKNYDSIFNKTQNLEIKSFNIEIHQLYDLIESTGFIYDSIKGLLWDSDSGLLIARQLEKTKIFVFDVDKLCKAFDAKLEIDNTFIDVKKYRIITNNNKLFYISETNDIDNNINIDNISKLRNYQQGKII